MGSFKWLVPIYEPGEDGAFIEEQWIDIVFSLIRNGRWVDPNNEDRRDMVAFDYLDHESIYVGLSDLDLDRDYDRDLWDMLLQVTNLDAS